MKHHQLKVKGTEIHIYTDHELKVNVDDLDRVYITVK